MPKVLVIYKSGARIQIKCAKFVVQRRDGRIERVTWNSAKPAPLHIGVDDIAAIYELEP